jgi:hypothetical protein
MRHWITSFLLLPMPLSRAPPDNLKGGLRNHRKMLVF